LASDEVNRIRANSLALLVNRLAEDSTDTATRLPLSVDVLPAPAGLARLWFTYNEQSH